MPGPPEGAKQTSGRVYWVYVFTPPHPELLDTKKVQNPSIKIEK